MDSSPSIRCIGRLDLKSSGGPQNESTQNYCPAGFRSRAEERAELISALATACDLTSVTVGWNPNSTCFSWLEARIEAQRIDAGEAACEQFGD